MYKRQLRKNRSIDWQKRDSARAKMRMMIKRLLKKHKYPQEGMDDAVATVMLQCELWTDNNDMEHRVVNYAEAFSKKAQMCIRDSTNTVSLSLPKRKAKAVVNSIRRQAS